MPMMAVAVRQLNRRFDIENIDEFAKRAPDFAPGTTLRADLFVQKGSDLERPMQAYIDRLPGSFLESLRSTIYYALTNKKQATFAWVPSYDFELQMWEPACGVTVLLKGRNPDEA
ncbi:MULTISPECIES: hypothetical protein [Phenylobacterium]|uniref:Uncharacterized protein n=1 Tax=Phenylobacterium koreense TaxID=266125 RepID=A0ABV2ELL8_9CAUL